ncbi:MAG: SMP-30/gluconolactonase/LRE family protein [Methylacidiphilales bacterium]|nr:SMP-30/gluconolactonase/LRE family protein [Candidatus Methylacidiphilales bacterium]
MTKFELLVPTHCTLGESPRWDEINNLVYWIDILECKIHCYYEKTGKHTSYVLPEPIGCLVLDKKGGLILALKSGIYYLESFNHTPQLIATSPEIHLKDNRFNDGRCDARGRLLIGTIYPPKDKGGANCYSFDFVTNTFKLIQDDLMTANGIAFSLDNQTLYLADTPRHCIYSYNYNLVSGTVSNKKIFAKFQDGKGRPDGASIDSDNYYWTALYDGKRIVRLSPLGEIAESYDFPCQSPTMVAFGGKNLKTMFVTCVGENGKSGLYCYESPFTGVVEWRCNGTRISIN